jgi:hypothetical protein
MTLKFHAAAFCIANLPGAYRTPIVARDVASQPNLARVHITGVDEAIQIDDETRDPRGQPQRHMVLLCNLQRLRRVEISLERIKPEPLSPLTVCLLFRSSEG